MSENSHKRVLLVKYGEIALRKRNRPIYEKQLADAIRGKINSPDIRVTREQGRLLVERVNGDLETEAVVEKIKRVFGITAFCPSIKTDTKNLDEIKRLSLEFLRAYSLRSSGPENGEISFKVETKRGDKSYPLTSREISSEVGGYILDNLPGLKVDVHKPDIILWIELRYHTYIYAAVIPGEGGLPYGSSGKGVLLLSGGIDSPVAGYLTARRGVEILPVYFHSPPYTSERAADKVYDIAKQLAPYTRGLKLYTVRFTDIQMYLYENVKPEKLTLFLKRAMLSVSSRVAFRENAHCLITGDSIGQVSSQTIHSIEAINSASKLPVIRPLAAMDKQQIIDIAQKIGTFEISVRPYEDCCTLFQAEHPECRPKASAIENIESRLRELPGLLEEAFNNSGIIEVP